MYVTYKVPWACRQGAPDQRRARIGSPSGRWEENEEWQSFFWVCPEHWSEPCRIHRAFSFPGECLGLILIVPRIATKNLGRAVIDQTISVVRSLRPPRHISVSLLWGMLRSRSCYVFTSHNGPSMNYQTRQNALAQLSTAGVAGWIPRPFRPPVKAKPDLVETPSYHRGVRTEYRLQITTLGTP